MSRLRSSSLICEALILMTMKRMRASSGSSSCAAAGGDGSLVAAAAAGGLAGPALAWTSFSTRLSLSKPAGKINRETSLLWIVTRYRL